MKKIIKLLVLACLAVSSLTAYSAALTSNKDIIGSWLLEYTKKSPDDPEMKSMGVTWVIDNNQLTQKDIPQVRGAPYDAPAVDYVVEEGNLKVSILGRAGKYDIYSLVEKTDTAMVLKDNKYGTYMYFSKK